MGEEEKKPAEEKKMREEKKPEEGKKPEETKGKDNKSEKPAEEKKEEKKTEESTPAPPPPQEIILKVYMHCEGCARKVRRCLKGFEGVDDIVTDCKTHKVVVKGEKADPLKVLERVQRKSHRQVELLSPIPKPPVEEEKKPQEEKPKPEEKKAEPPQVIMVVLKAHMHCEACAQEIKKRILRMKGVESAEPDLKSSLVTVKGVFDPPALVEYVYKRTGKQAVIVKQEPEKKEEEKGNKDTKGDKKGEEGGDKEKKAGGEENKEKKEGGDNSEAKLEATEETKLMELKSNEYYFYPPRYAMEFAYPHQAYQQEAYPHQAYPQQTYPQAVAYAPEIFSDENPNACSVM